jgi:hypothetical protein
MIFGFNTDVKHGDTIYHVQSEARESEKLLQTQVFVRGRCVGKKAISYANSAAQAGFGDPQKEQQLRDQHRMVLESIREGKLENVLDHAETEAIRPSRRRTFLHPGCHRFRRQRRHLHRSRRIRLARLLRHGASQPRRPHRNPQIRSPQSRVERAGGRNEVSPDPAHDSGLVHPFGLRR